ncbi:hypothetical protein ACLMJK_005581 [Lecanora helva]
MGDYESGYDPKYGYNRNAFANPTLPLVIVGRTVKLIASPIGLVSEAIHKQKEKKRQSGPQVESQPAAEKAETAKVSSEIAQRVTSPPEASGDEESPVYVEVPTEQADELIQTHQAVPADGKTATHELVPTDSEADHIERDEADWDLDEATFETEERADPEVESRTDEAKAAKDAVSNRGQPVQSANNSHLERASSNNLPYPVVLPQRRPGTKARGFVRAYAPALQDSGIDQEMFLNFLKNFHKAAQASPIFDVIMIATAIAGAYPDILVGLAVQAVQIAAAMGQEVQERWRTNKFLDQANREIFMPRGLYALIVSYKPGESEQTEMGTQTVDLGASAMAKYGENLTKPEDPAGDRHSRSSTINEMKRKMQNLRISSGETRGEAEFPVSCAKLTFPALDAVAAVTEGYKSKDQSAVDNILAKSKSSSKFVADYLDRRAQASYTVKNPKSTLTAQMGPAAPQFKSRFADPNNHTNKHFFTLITGGKFKAEPLGARRRYEKAQRKAEEKRMKGLKEKSSKRMLKEGVLYLMIVNMPTEQELEVAKKKIQTKDKKDAANK